MLRNVLCSRGRSHSTPTARVPLIKLARRIGTCVFWACGGCIPAFMIAYSKESEPCLAQSSSRRMQDLRGYEAGASAVVLSFENNYRIVIPHIDETRNDDDWYAHWYAREVDRKTAKGTNVRRQS